MGLLENQNIRLVNLNFSGCCIKSIELPDTFNDHITAISLISSFTNADIIQEIIDDVHKAIAGDFNSITDPDVINPVGAAFITPHHIEFWDEEIENVVSTYSLEDFMELLVAWRDFLLAPPLNGSKL